MHSKNVLALLDLVFVSVHAEHSHLSPLNDPKYKKVPNNLTNDIARRTVLVSFVIRVSVLVCASHRLYISHISSFGVSLTRYYF